MCSTAVSPTAIDVLVHNAAVSPHMGATMDTTEQVRTSSACARLCARCSSGTNHGQTIDKIMQVNLKAPFLLTKARLATLCCWNPSAHWLPWCLGSRKRFLTCVRVGMFS